MCSYAICSISSLQEENLKVLYNLFGYYVQFLPVWVSVQIYALKLSAFQFQNIIGLLGGLSFFFSYVELWSM